MGYLVSDYTPETGAIREAYLMWCADMDIDFNADKCLAEFCRWLARYRESVIDEVEDHLVRRDQFTEQTLDVIDELRDDTEKREFLDRWGGVTP